MNKVVLVTGGAQGIGKAIVLELAKNHYDVVINYLTSNKAAALLEEEIKKNYDVRVMTIQADVSKEEEVDAMISLIEKKWGGVDILVNNAGIIKRQDAIEFTEENWDSVIQVNQKMVFFLSQAFAKQLMKQGEGGKIINVCSMLSYQGGIRVPSYTASKSAIIGLTRALANEWAKYNINVNGIAPGYMATNNTAQLRDDADRSEAILDRIPAGRWGTPQDMEGAVIYLASKASDYVNGFTLAVDGGWLAR